MTWPSVIAIYALFWAMSGFIVLRFGMRTGEETGIAHVPGQADSAPAEFRPGQIILRTTALATVLCALFYANYVNGWITTSDLDWSRFLSPPPRPT